MSPRRSPRKPVLEAAQAGALAGGLFLSSLGALRACLRLGLIQRGEVGLLLPLAILLVLAPLGVGLKFGFRDDMPPSLRAYRQALPWARTPTEELVGSVTAGAAWSALGMALSSLAARFIPNPGVDAIVLATLGPALAGWAVWAIHGRAWPAGRAFAVVAGAVFFLAAPQLLLGPRSPVVGPRGRAVLAREYADLAERFQASPTLAARARALSWEGCAAGDARACFAAAQLAAGSEGSDEAAALLTRRGCDLEVTNFYPCESLVGEGFSPAQPPACSVEAQCEAGFGVDCKAGLVACKQALSPRSMQPACARREGGGWREVWCAHRKPW